MSERHAPPIGDRAAPQSPFQDAARLPDSRLARSIRNAVLTALALLFLWLTIQVDLVIFGGILLAVCLRGLAMQLNRVSGIGTARALAIVVLLILVVIVGIAWFFSQSIAGQIEQLSQQLPTAAEKLLSSLRHSELGRTLAEHIGTGKLETSPAGLVKGFFGIASNAFEVIGALIVVAFLGIYFAAEAELYANGLLRLVPPLHRPRAGAVLEATATAVRYWMLGRLVAMIALGILAGAGLWVLGVPLPGALGVLAGVMVFVPYIGSVVSAVPAVLLGAATDLRLALYVIALYIGIHLVEGYVLVPLVQRRVVHLPPALILSGQLILGVLAGLLGLLFATPLIAIGLVLVRMVYVEGILGDAPEPEWPAATPHS